MRYIKFDENRTLEEANTIYETRIRDAAIVYNMFSKSFVVRNCPICDSNDYSEKDKFIGKYDVSLCNVCNSDYVNPVPSIDALRYYYNECESNLLFAELNKRRQKKDFRLDERVQFLKPYINAQLEKNNTINILEVGCNNGTFLSALKDYLASKHLLDRVSLYGIDLDENAINDNVDDSLKLKNLAAEDLALMNISFNIIINYELIEHLNDPSTFIKSIYRNLSNQGSFIFTTPNSLGLEIKSIGYNKKRFLAHSIFPPMHLNSFNTSNILLFANRHKFKVKHLDTPGKLDMDLITKLSSELNDDELGVITNFNENVKAYIQYLVSYLNGSSHMRVVLEK